LQKESLLKALFTISISLFVFNLFAQNSEIKREIHYTAEAGTILSTNGETPFWLRANQYGTVPNQSPIFTLRGSVSSDYKKAVTKEDQYKLSKFDWGYGLNIVGNVGKENQFLIPEAYLKAKYGAFEIYAGRRKEIVGLVDTALSSGSYIWSGNALPMPKVQISTPNFVPLGFTGDFLSFKGSYAHGWFENSRTDVKNFYLHQKTLYFRLGKPDWKFHFYGGFNHQVQWGGELKFPDPTGYLSKDGKLPSSFSDYLGVIIGKSLAVEGDTSKFGGNDAENRAGNHLGTVDFGFDIITSNFRMLIYRQNIYETGMLFYLSSISDGLNGISFANTNTNIKNGILKFTFEYLNTNSQGGLLGSDQLIGKLRGKTDYFNQGQYIDGWTNQFNTIGSPFFIPSLPIDRTKSLQRLFNNNKIEAYYFAINGRIINKLDWICNFSYTQNKGTPDNLFPKTLNQFSGKLSVKYPINLFKNSIFMSSLGFDSGEYLKDNFGGFIGVRRNI
jgi:hypothetical protein